MQLCPRAWQAEAAFDGSLSRADSASFGRHAATCSVCSAERDSLLRLQSLADRMPPPRDEPLRRRALHNELLRRATEHAFNRRSSLFSRARVGVLAAICVLAAALFFGRHLRQVTVSERAQPSFQVHPTPGSRWRVVEPGRSLRLAVEAGKFSFAVDKLTHGQRFALSLPDGELEVRGTHFTVEASAQHTLRVSVVDGLVALRLSGRPELLLAAGDSWPRAVVSESRHPLLDAPANSVAPTSNRVNDATTPSATQAGGAPANPRVAPSRLVATAPRGSEAALAPFRATPAAEATGASGRSAPSTSAAEDFARVMRTFSLGDYGSAEPMLAAFEARYPHSAHREDVLFLRALARSRRGDARGARLFARQYLEEYPSGFRAAEAQRLAR